MMKSNWPSAARSIAAISPCSNSRLRKAQRLDAPAPLVDLDLRQIDAHYPRLGMPRGERDQVAAGRASDFQHARAGHIRYVQPEKMSDRRQMPRRRLRERMRLVRRRVVRSTHAVNRIVHLSPFCVVLVPSPSKRDGSQPSSAGANHRLPLNRNRLVKPFLCRFCVFRPISESAGVL